MKPPILETLQEVYIAIGWTIEPPKDGGWYWHWNGDNESGPLPFSIGYSGTTGKCFVMMGQLGIERAVNCDEYGGWWMPIYDPKPPQEQEDERRCEISMQKAMKLKPTPGRLQRAAKGEI